MQRKLTAKQELFVAEYMIDLNATQASIRAGYSERNADKIGPQLIGHPRVGAAIAAAKGDRAEKLGVDANWVLAQLLELWTADIQDIVAETGAYKPIREWPPVWRKMLDGMDVKELYERSGDGKDKSWDKIGEIVKIRFVNRLSTLQKIGDHILVKAFPQRESTININITADEITDRLHAGRAKVEGDRVH